jgi:hypothetical protein
MDTMSLAGITTFPLIRSNFMITLKIHLSHRVPLPIRCRFLHIALLCWNDTETITMQHEQMRSHVSSSYAISFAGWRLLSHDVTGKAFV